MHNKIFFAILWSLILLSTVLHAQEVKPLNVNATISNIPPVIPHPKQPSSTEQEVKNDHSKYTPIKQESPPPKAEGIISAASTNAEVKDGTVKIEVINRQTQQTVSLYGALIAIGVPLLVLLVTNLVTLWKIRLESKAAIKGELGMNSIERIKEQLSLFYDPIIALLYTNSEIFNGFGPRTFPEDHFAGEEALHIWSLMVNDVVLPNNKEVTKTIKSYSHLMSENDDFELYLRFMKHAASYDAFRNTPNQLHGDFAYPTDLLPNVKKHRNNIVRELQKLQLELPK